MLIFSVFCLLKAAVPELPMDVVIDRKIYRTRPPLQIAGFGQSADEAGRYASLLNKYQTSQPSSKTTNLSNPFGKFSISSYEFVTTGWMIRHKGAAGRSFMSYVVSKINVWTELQKTIDDILTSHIEGYIKAFPISSHKQMFDPTNYPGTEKRPFLEEPNSTKQKTLKEQFDRFVPTTEEEVTKYQLQISQMYNKTTEERQQVEATYKNIQSQWSNDIFDIICQKNPYNALLLNAYIFQRKINCEKTDEQLYVRLGHISMALDNAIDTWYKNLLTTAQPKLTIPSQDSIHTVKRNVRPETGIAAERELFDRLTLDQKYQKFKQFFDSLMKRPFVYVQRLNQFPHGWGENNCLFLALSAHPELLQEVINLLWTENDKPNVLDCPGQIDKSFPSLGGQLRQKFCNWLRKNEQVQFYTDPENKTSITVKNFIIGIHPQASVERQTLISKNATLTVEAIDAIIFEDYIKRQMGGTTLMAAELYDILSILLKRRIISVSGPYGHWDGPHVQCLSPRLDQIDVTWRPEIEAPTVYVLTSPESHHWATAAHLVS